MLKCVYKNSMVKTSLYKVSYKRRSDTCKIYKNNFLGGKQIMNSKLLSLNIKKYLCPFCGAWHDFGREKESCLAEYKQYDEFYCHEHDKHCFSIECNDNNIMLKLRLCLQGYNYDKNTFTIPITAFVECDEEPTIIAEFDLDNEHFKKNEQEKICESEDVLNIIEGCSGCISYYKNFFEMSHKMKIGFGFKREDYFLIHKKNK